MRILLQKLTLFLIGCLFVHSSVLAKTIVFSGEENIRAGQGLPSDTVFSLAQDQLGFIWVGTPSGIGILDGYGASVYSIDNGALVANYSPGNIYIDKQDHIWVGTWGNGLYRVTDNRQSIFPFPQPIEGESLLAQQRIKTILKSTSDELWVGTFDNGLIHIGGDGSEANYKRQASPNRRLLHDRVWSVAEDHLKNIWVGTSNGLNKINSQTGAIENYFNDDQLSIANRLVRTILPIGDQLWVGTNLGIFRVHIDTGKVENMLPENIAPVAINKIKSDGRSGLWIATFNGLFHFDLLTERYSTFENGGNSYLASKDIQDILVTSDELLILATRFSGVVKLNTVPKTFKILSDPLAEAENKNHIFSIATDMNNRIWAGTNNGLVRYDVATSTRSLFDSVLAPFQVGRISAVLATDGGRTIWFGTSNNLYKYDVIENRLYEQGQLLEVDSLNHIQMMLEDTDGNIWIKVAHQGLFKLTRHGEIDHYHVDAEPEFRIPNDSVVEIKIGFNGDIWLITGDLTVMRKSHGNKRFQTFDLSLSPQADKIKLISTTFTVTKDKRLLIGTYSGLLVVKIETGESELLTVEQGLSSNDIRSVIEDEFNHYWIATGNGVSILNQVGDIERVLTQKDGLSSNALNLRSVFPCLERTFCFGTDSGINLVKPSKVIDLLKSAPVVITNVWINNVLQKEPVTGTDSLFLNLDSHYRNLRFQFGDIDHAPNAGTALYYKLQGFEENWNLSNISRIANYTNLAPGEYTFQVTANPQGFRENNKNAQVAINIIPPFWEQTHTQFVSAVTLLLIAIFLYRIRISQIRKTENRLNKLVDVRAENMAVLGAIGMEITRAVSFEEIFERLKHHLKSVLYAHKFMLGMVNESKTQLHFDLVIKKTQKLPGFTAPFTDAQHPAVWSFQEQHELIVTSKKELQNVLKHETFTEQNQDCESLACIPLKVDDAMIGVIMVQSNLVNAYGEYERQFLRTIAAYTAIALKNAQFYIQEKEQQLKRISWLENITHYLNHEMKNAILGAQTSLSMMSRKTDDQDLVKYIGRAKRSHEEMRNIMAAVSNTTSLEAAIMRADLRTISLSEVIQERTLEYKHIYKDVNLVTDIATDIVIRGNVDLMIQGLDKLVNNAIEHHKAGTNIIVSLKRHKNLARISVRNLGDPLPEDIEYIFGLFTSTKANASSGNYGMGLYIATLIADLHNGAITARPFDLMGAEGAIFEIDIPLYEMPFNQTDIHLVSGAG